MDLLEAFILGAIQGLTEWLPISSSGHLVIAQDILGLPTGKNLLFDLVLHLGTLLAVCAYFRKELGRIAIALLTPKARRDEQMQALRTLGLLLLLATVPVGVIGILLTDVVDEVFNTALVGSALVVNGLLLVTFERLGSKGVRRNASLVDALVIGACQAVAILPGISRSGITIGGGMMRGLEREVAAVFAFLLSVPTLAGAFAYGAVTLDAYDLDLGTALVGFTAAVVAGFLSIQYLLKAIRKNKLWVFGAYCLTVGAAVLLWTWL